MSNNKLSKFGKYAESDQVEVERRLGIFPLIDFFALPINVNGPPLSMKLHREEGRYTSPKLRRTAAACHWGNE